VPSEWQEALSAHAATIANPMVIINGKENNHPLLDVAAFKTNYLTA